jgi:hypothetical protein
MNHHHGDTHGIHGMLVLGGQRTGDSLRSPVYVSHLPMFMSPHDFQVIVRVTGEAARRYGDFVAHFGSSDIYTFKPEPFSIDELDPTRDRGAARTSFGGTLYRGHFERGGSEIASDALFEVEQVVLFRRFGPAAGGGARDQLRYVCFGERDAAFLAHLITGPPDFDQVLNVEVSSPGDLSDEDLGSGVVVRVPERANDVGSRLHEGERCLCDVEGEPAGRSASLELVVALEYYLETGDLAASM